ncbi:mitochondrial 54S ribosomal protein YmL9 [Starmerella bacillaris]|uniref:Large ribosomal subunit protein uL3m n=1 Tax=Starmerella bacillaris TaxID=1247836 RepID=A0AAV5RNP3_STABA|nr:mitochondrial 54S ribosomal protein YmL9 [Starmerella bacillaris]
MRLSSISLAQLTANSVVRVVKSEAPLLFTSPSVAHERRRLLNRPGLLGYKRGMVPYFKDGKVIACTVVEVDRCQVTDVKTAEKHGYYALQLGCGSKKPDNVTRQMLGHFARAEVAPKKNIAEFHVRNENGLLPLGTFLRPSHLKVGQFVDVQSKSRGKGFQGVMKRWGFAGQPASHGVSVVHRSAGSIGQNTDPARVFPGKKMAGRMGFETRTIQNVEVIEVDDANGLVLLKGSIAGADGRFLKISDAIKRPLPKD